MPEIKIHKCDLCHTEITPKEWYEFMGKFILSGKNISGFQNENIIEMCCYNCAKKIFDSGTDAILEIISERK